MTSDALGFGYVCPRCHVPQDEGNRTGIFFESKPVCQTCALALQSERDLAMTPNGNGNVRAFSPKALAPDVPIVGQPFTMKAWFLQLLITCNCSARREPVLVIGQIGATSAPCPLCGRQFVLQAVNANAQGQLQLSIASTVPGA